MQSVSPVINEKLIEHERVIALDQPEYKPIIIIAACTQPDKSDYCLIVRFKLSDEERVKVAAGADLILSELTFGRAFTPVALEFCLPEEIPSFVEVEK